MSRTAAQREKARTRKQRQRDREREQRRIAAEALADKREAQAEKLAPKVLREAIITKAGLMLLGPRVHIVNGRPVRALALTTPNDPIDNLARESPRITDRHKRAARMLQQDWHDVGAGVNVGAVDYLRAGGSGDGSGGHDALMAQVAAYARLEGALAHMGALSGVVRRVVLDCIPVSVWAQETRGADGEPMTREDAMTQFVAGLTRLAGFYWPPRPAKPEEGGVLTFGPARGTYSVEMEEENLISG